MNEIIPRIGGPNRIVEIDEIAFRRGQLVSNPTNETEDERETCWIIGAIQRRTCNEPEELEQSFFIKIILYRRDERIANNIRENILLHTTIHSDAHRSYPCAINICNRDYNMNLMHEIVKP